jgi:DNA polymerase III delta subunit
MPKIEPKLIQKELDGGKIRPVYWIYGPERMKARELIKRVQKTVLGDAAANDFNFEKLDASEVSLETVIDAAQSFSLMGGVKLLLVRNAEDFKQLEPLVEFLKQLPSTDPAPVSELSNVVVFISKSFDGRKKTSKQIQDLAVIIQCEEVADQDREPWIDYLSKRRGLVLKPEERLLLRGLDPWSLEIADQELSKLELVAHEDDLRSQVLLSGVDSHARDEFIDAIFCRDEARSLKWMHLFSEEMEVQLPVLGLICWNLRHLKLLILEQETRSRSPEKRNPYLMKNLERWRKHWNLASIQKLEENFFQIDFALKNTRLLGRGLWSSMIFNSAVKSSGPSR